MADDFKAGEVFNKYAELYEEKYMDVSRYQHFLNVFLSHIHLESAKILDLACGPGNLSRFILDQRPKIKILGIDISKTMIRLAKNNNPEAEFKVMDCRKIEMLKQKYDGIVIGFCLPYLAEEETKKLIFDSSNLLKFGGVVYISTMISSKVKSGFEGSDAAREKLFINYHQSRFLKKELAANNLECMDSFHLENPANKPGVIDLVLIARKKHTLK